MKMHRKSVLRMGGGNRWENVWARVVFLLVKYVRVLFAPKRVRSHMPKHAFIYLACIKWRSTVDYSFIFLTSLDSANDYFTKLKSLVEETYKANGNKQVTLLSHSLGCPYTLVFLNKQTNEWKNTYIKHWITLSGQ